MAWGTRSRPRMRGRARWSSCAPTYAPDRAHRAGRCEGAGAGWRPPRPYTVPALPTPELAAEAPHTEGGEGDGQRQQHARIEQVGLPSAQHHVLQADDAVRHRQEIGQILYRRDEALERQEE